MSDTLNSLLSANRSSSVLQGIANPAQVNPLAAINSAAQTAGNVFQVRQLQAQQAIGDILQQSTDPTTGMVNYPEAQRRAAAAGQGVQMGMAKFLQDTSGLRGSQQTQAVNHINNTALAQASILFDPSDENINRRLDEAIAGGMDPDRINHTRQQLLATKDPVQRQRMTYAAMQSMLAPGASIDRNVGTTTLENTGGLIQPYTTTPPAPGRPATFVPGQGSAETRLDPASAAAMGINYIAGQSDVDAGDAKSVGERVFLSGPEVLRRQQQGRMLPPAAQLNAPQGGARPPAVVVNPGGAPVSPGNPAVATRPPPRQLNIQPAPSLSNTPLNTMPATPVPASGGPRVPTSSLDAMGGVQVASANPLEAPTVGAPSEPSPLVPGDVAAIQAGMQNAQNTPRIPGTKVAAGGFSAGQGLGEQTDYKLSQDRLLADSTRAADYAQNILPYTQSLNMYGRGMTTGPGTEWFNGVKGRAGAVLRSMGFTGAFDSTREYDELHKWLQQLVTSNPGAAASDARLAATLAGNANVGIHELAGEDMVKVGAAMMRMNAAVRQNWDDIGPAGQAKYGGYYSNYLRDTNRTLDLRAFASDLYNPHQLKTLREDLAAHDDAYSQNYLNSLALARRSGYASPVKAMP
jgi:hypothetical protein